MQRLLPERITFVFTVALSLMLTRPHFLQHSNPESSTTHSPEAVHEEMFVRIGGIDQWITIKGDDRNNPVILFLHGGPGDAWSPFGNSLFRGWDKNFTLVQWDQRGAGRTYGKTGPSIEPTMTMKRMVDDGIELSEFLTKHLHKRKIIIDGASWGSILGIHMAHARPDLFYAYIGEGQIVNERKNLAACYARVLELARAARDQDAMNDLTAIGSPPWDSLRKWPVYRRWELKYQDKVVTASPARDEVSAGYDSAKERAQWHAADDFSFLHFVKMDLSGEFMQVDLPALGTKFAIPIFIIQGQEDLTALPELAESYLESIKAPRKQFYLIPGSGHEMSAPSLDLTLKVLTEQVRPLALEH
jgi:pimeloyl-ACP methyl ester carboxylesterase